MRHLLYCLVFACNGLHAESVSLPDTDVIHLKSKANGVEYKLYVSHPHDFHESELEYPLIVSLDADYSFAIVRNIVEHLSGRRDTPPMVVVSIAYAGDTSMRSYRMNRSRDYTPVFDPDDGYGAEFQRDSGGALKFAAFIRDELLPLIGKRYRASGRRALVGHSYGGLFASYVMLEEPGLFDGYIIVSPSYWYHDRWVFNREAELAESRRALDATVYLAVGDSEASRMVADFREFVAQLRSRDLQGLTLESDVMSNETHNSLFPRAVSNGIRMIWPRETGRAWPATGGH